MRVSSSGVVTSWGAMTRLTVKPRREIGRGENGRQICRAMTWKVPENLSKVHPGKAVQRAAVDWEEARAAYEKNLYDPERTKDQEVDRTKTDFVRFVLGSVPA